MELSDKKIELVNIAIVGSENYNSELYSLDAVRTKVIKKSSFILSSLTDDGLISKYLKKVVEDTLLEFKKEIPDEVYQKTVDKNYEDYIEDIEPQNEEPTTENDPAPSFDEDIPLYSLNDDEDDILNAYNSTDYKDDIDQKIDSLSFVDNNDFSDFVENIDQADSVEISKEEVIEKVEEIQEAESFAHNEELDKVEIVEEPEVQEEFTDNLLITPDIEIENEEAEPPVFDLPKEEFPTLNPETLYKEVEDPIEYNEVKTVPQEITDKILGILIEATKNPETKDYIKIFYLKYIKKYKQIEIAKLLDISEAELSETYFAMVKFVKSNLY